MEFIVKHNKRRWSDPAPPLRPSRLAAAAALTGEVAAIEKSITTAQAHWEAGQNQQAEMLCLQILSRLPDHAPALHLMGLIAHTVGKLPEAMEFMRAACASPQAPAMYHSNRAEICRQAGQLDEAERAARRAVALDPANAGATSNLGIIVQEAGKPDESLPLLRRAVELDPANAEFHNNLGNTLQQCGLLLQARQAYDAAIELNGDYDNAYANLARLLVEMGEFDAALAAARQAIDINPQCGPAYLHEATVLIKRQQLQLALRRIDAVLNFMPANAQALHLRSTLLLAAAEPEEAEAAARQAVSLTPRSGDAVLALARVLQVQGRPDEALALFEQAAHLSTTRADAIALGHAGLLIELGRMQQAQAMLLQVLERSPYCAAAWLRLSTIMTFAPQADELAVMQQALAQGQRQGLAMEDRIALHFALGKAHLDGGDIAAALDAYDQANRLQRSLIDYDAAANSSWMAEIARQVPPRLLQKIAASGAGNASEVPVFVVGMPRSGTTLVEQILASHRDVFGADELPLVQEMIERIVGPDEQLLPYPALMTGLDPQDFTELGSYYAQAITALAPDRVRIVDKMPLNFLYIGLIRAMLPNARIIHIRRNAVDTCMSCYCQPFNADQKFTFDLTELGRFYQDYLALMAHWRNCVPSSHLFEIDYEDLVDDLEGNARRLIDFCGLPWDAACLAFHTTERRVRTASMAQVRRPIYRASIGRWASQATRLAPLLTALGACVAGQDG